MKRKKGIFKFLAFVGVVVVIALLMMIPAVANAVGKVTGVTGERIRSVASTIVGAGVGVLLVGWGVAALSVPFVGVAMIVIGLALMAYTLWPLFRPANKVAGAAGLSINKAA